MEKERRTRVFSHVYYCCGKLVGREGFPSIVALSCELQFLFFASLTRIRQTDSRDGRQTRGESGESARGVGKELTTKQLTCRPPSTRKEKNATPFPCTCPRGDMFSVLGLLLVATTYLVADFWFRNFSYPQCNSSNNSGDCCCCICLDLVFVCVCVWRFFTFFSAFFFLVGFRAPQITPKLFKPASGLPFIFCCRLSPFFSPFLQCQFYQKAVDWSVLMMMMNGERLIYISS